MIWPRIELRPKRKPRDVERFSERGAGALLSRAVHLRCRKTARALDRSARRLPGNRICDHAILRAIDDLETHARLAPPSKPRPAQRLACNVAHAEQHDAMSRRAPNVAIGADELRLTLGKQHKLGAHGIFVEPCTRRVRAHDRDAVAVLQELAQPGHMAIATAE